MSESRMELKEIGLDDAPEPPKMKTCMRTNLLTILTIGGVVLGGGLGFALRETSGGAWTNRHIMYVNFVGDIFLRMLKSLILPLIVSSLISAIANLDLSLSGKIAAKAIAFYLTTTFCSVVLGIILVVAIRPGDGFVEAGASPKANLRNVTTVDTLLDLLRNMFSPNVVQACIEQYRTVLIRPKNGSAELLEWDIGHEYQQGTNILGLIVFSSAFGIALAKLGAQTLPVTKFFDALATTMMAITTWVIWISPIGVLFLVASKILEIKDFGEMMGQLGMYFLTVVAGVLIQGFIILPIIYVALTRKNPFTYISNMAQALATAFGTSSSSATLPVTIRCIEENSGVDPRVARFCLPIGAVINMDGTALYEAVAAIFIAQVRSIDLSLGHLIAVSITATAASIGAAGIPQAGLVTMVMVLDTLGLPAEDVTLIIAIDWLLDRFRTVVNVMGDSFGAGIVNHLSKKELEDLPEEQSTSVTVIN